MILEAVEPIRIRLSYTYVTSINVTDGLFHVAKTEGVGALWRGTLPSLMLVSNPALQFMAYEAIKRRLLAGRPSPAELGSVAVFLVGAAAKAFATVTTYPLQLVQTKLRVSRWVGGGGVPSILAMS